MRLTGHKTASIFRRYDIVDGRDLAEGVRKLAGLVSGTKRAQPTTKGAKSGNSGAQIREGDIIESY